MKADAWLEVDALDVVAAAHQPALARDLSFRLRPGQRLGLIGRNGAGKSTLLRQLAGLLPLHGETAAVRLAGQPLSELGPERLAALRTLMPAQPRDRFNLSALALLELSQPEPDGPSAHEALRQVDAWALRDRPVLDLSAGERQRVSLAQALVQGATLLLLDEPVAFQDPGHQSLVGAMLSNLNDRVVVFCAHDVNWVARCATHVLGLGVCRALVVESENGAQRGQFLPDLQTHSPAMGQKDGEKWTAATHLQPTIPKPDRLLGLQQDAQGWFFDSCEAALQTERLHHLYDCRWTQLRDASGLSAWVAL